MKLTAQQIQYIENYLDARDLNYVDFRMEVLDHIVSEIEENIKDKTDFNKVFKAVVMKWDKELIPTNSFFFGMAFTAPKMIIKRAKNIYIYYHIFVFLAVLAVIIRPILNITINYSTVNLLLFLTVLFITTCVSLGVIIKTVLSKQRTVYSFLVNTHKIAFSMFPIIIFIEGFFSRKNLDLTLLILFALLTIMNVIFYKYHKQELKKYKIKFQ